MNTTPSLAGRFLFVTLTIQSKGVAIMKFTSEKSDQILASCAKLYCAIWQEPPWNEDFWTSEKVLADMEKEFSFPFASAFFAIQETTGEIVGFTWGYEVSLEKMRGISGNDQLDVFFSSQSRVFYIDELGVRSDQRGLGIGKKLSSRLIATFKASGATTILLRTDMEAVSARKLYAEIGFQELAEKDVTYSNRDYWVLKI